MTVARRELPILAAAFLDLLGFGMIVADIQLRAESLVPKGWPIGLLVGGLLASTFVIQLIVSPIWGRLSDAKGRKPIMIACTLLSAAAMLVYGLAGSLWVLLLSRVLSGFGAANVAVAQAYLSDSSDPDSRTAIMGRFGAATSAGLVVGPALGGFLAAAGGNLYVGLTAGAASMAGALWMALGVPSAPPTLAKAATKRSRFNLGLLADVPRLRPLVLIAVVAWLSLATLEGTFARLIEHLFHYDQRHFGVIFGFESILGVAVQALLVGWAAKRLNPRTLLRCAYCVQGVGLGLNPFAGALAPAVIPFVLLLAASTLYAIGAGIANPTVNSQCSRLAPEDRQGELFGLLQGTRSAGFVIGPLVGGSLFDWNPAAPYLLAAIVCCSAAFLVPKLAN